MGKIDLGYPKNDLIYSKKMGSNTEMDTDNIISITIEELSEE